MNTGQDIGFGERGSIPSRKALLFRNIGRPGPYKYTRERLKYTLKG